MATANVVLMRSARESLKDQWGLAIGTFLVYTLIMCSFGAMQKVGVVALLIAGPMSLGAAIFSLSLSRGKEARLEQIFDGFRFFTNALITYLLMVLYVFLWLLLLIVPGIIAALSYSMVFYILADNPTLEPQAVLDQSKRMMDGYKWKLFYLFLRFFLLALLCVLTLGIGFLWFVPFVHVTMAKFYDDIKTNPQFNS
ncbi:DUF975 family protein [Mucilaginibacter puniceus]